MKLIVGLSGNLPSQISGNSFLSEYNSFYRPFFQILYGYPSVPIVLYFSGLWYEWLADEHPEVLTLISEMMKRNRQVELLGGAYYEPYLPLLQTTDRIGQIDSLTTTIRQRFLKRPKQDLAGGLRSPQAFPGFGAILQQILIAQLGAYGVQNTFWP